MVSISKETVLSRTSLAIVIQETCIISYQHLRFDLLDGLKYDAYNNDERRPAKGNICPEYAVKEIGDHLHDDQSTGSDKYDIIEYLCQIFHRRLSRTDAGDKSTVFLHIVCNFQWIECNRRIEICKKYRKHNIED